MALLLALVSTFVALGSASGRPEASLLVPRVSLGEVLRALSAGRRVVFVDVREPQEYGEFHLPGALNLPTRSLTPDKKGYFEGADLVIPYCSEGFRGFEGGRLLRRMGVEGVRLLQEEGLAAWAEAGLPLAGAVARKTDLEAMAELYERVLRQPGPRARGRTLAGDVRIHEGFPSEILGNRRDILVYLPPGYEENPAERYPVLYVHDGQNVFDAATAAFGVEWGLDETAERLIREGKLREILIVAIPTARRTYEYTPLADPRFGGGGAEAYAEFLLTELKPFIDRKYRTLPDPQHTATMGASLGGLCSLYLGWKHPEIFGQVAALSPALWWADGAVLEQLREAPGGPRRVWLDAGTDESPLDRDENGVPDHLDRTRAMWTILVDKGYRRGESLSYREIPGAQHDEKSWGQRAGEVLVWLFGEPPPASSRRSPPARDRHRGSSPDGRGASPGWGEHPAAAIQSRGGEIARPQSML